jgi:hypothetical protein
MLLELALKTHSSITYQVSSPGRLTLQLTVASLAGILWLTSDATSMLSKSTSVCLVVVRATGLLSLFQSFLPIFFSRHGCLALAYHLVSCNLVTSRTALSAHITTKCATLVSWHHGRTPYYSWMGQRHVCQTWEHTPKCIPFSISNTFTKCDTIQVFVGFVSQSDDYVASLSHHTLGSFLALACIASVDTRLSGWSALIAWITPPSIPLLLLIKNTSRSHAASFRSRRKHWNSVVAACQTRKCQCQCQPWRDHFVAVVRVTNPSTGVPPR